MNNSSEQGTGTIRIYDGRGDNNPLETVDKLHRAPVHLMTVRYNSSLSSLALTPIRSTATDLTWSSPPTKAV
jgi:hypothetical protein